MKDEGRRNGMILTNNQLRIKLHPNRHHNLIKGVQVIRIPHPAARPRYIDISKKKGPQCVSESHTTRICFEKPTALCCVTYLPKALSPPTYSIPAFHM